MALAGADEWASQVLGVSSKPGTKGLPEQLPLTKASKTKVVSALRIYLSALLILMGGYKADLLTQFEFDEREWVDFWRQVFEYQPDDMNRFDKVFLPEFQKEGLEGLVGAIITEISGLFDQEPTPHDVEKQRLFLQTSFIKDLTAVERALKQGKGGRPNDCH